MKETAILPMRRMGSSVIHLVPIMPESLGVGHFVTDFRGTDAPVVSICMAQLNGTKVWMQNGTVCRRCERLAARYGHTVAWYENEAIR